MDNAMTLRISGLAADLPDFLTSQAFLPVRDILRDRSIVPDRRGLYGWWFRDGIPGVPLSGTLTSSGYHLLYVGIAPRAPSRSGSESRSTLSRRICRNHLGSRLASSTLRRSLACLLRDQFRLDISVKAKKLVMPKTHEAALTQWMAEFAAPTLLPDEVPWHLEDQLLAHGPALPLNIKGASHEFRAELSSRRAAIGIAAQRRV